MLNIYKTDESILHKLEKPEDGAWIQLVNPTSKEVNQISEFFELEVNDVAAALDEEESSRISLEEGYTLILVDIPTTEVRHEKKMYTTIPLGIILKQDIIITICREDTPILQYFINNRVREFSTKKKMRFLYQILF